MEVQHDYPSGDSPGCARALRAAVVARADYVRVLRIFTELVLDGKVPDEGSDAA